MLKIKCPFSKHELFMLFHLKNDNDLKNKSRSNIFSEMLSDTEISHNSKEKLLPSGISELAPLYI